jgi:hypothetical protein
MIQGTTPTHTFTLPFNADTLTAVRFTYKQNGKIVLEKEGADVVKKDNTISVKLTQEETLMFQANCVAILQPHVKTTGGDAFVSIPPAKISVHKLESGKVI